jgi:hypothetical protein
MRKIAEPHTCPATLEFVQNKKNENMIRSNAEPFPIPSKSRRQRIKIRKAIVLNKKTFNIPAVRVLCSSSKRSGVVNLPDEGLYIK